MGKHLTYAGRLELTKSVLHGMVQFWVSIFPMPRAVIRQITCICETSCGQEISPGVSLLLWLGKLYVYRKMKEAWGYLIFKPVTTVL